MRRELLTWFSSLVILCLLALSACESTFTAPEAGDYGPQKQKQLKDIYDIMTKASGKGHRRTYGKVHVVHHLKVSQKAKAIYGGASDLKRPRTSHSAASAWLVKPPTLFFSAMFIFALF